jgi:hypothetical protein
VVSLFHILRFSLGGVTQGLLPRSLSEGVL